MPTRRLLGAAAAAVDLAVRRTALARTGGQREADALKHEVRIALLRRLERRYEHAGAFDRYFRPPRTIAPTEKHRRPTRRGQSVIDVSWPSDYETFLADVRERYDRAVENRTATARLFVHRHRRPIIVCIHGYLGGAHGAESRIWPLPFFHSLGVDVALFVLPFHGPRARAAFGARPPFPGADPRMTNEGFRQAMGDFRDFVRYLLERGHPKVGVMGMSLGGYSTALAATLEPELAFAVPIIPLASVADTALHHGFLGSGPDAEAQHRALAAVYRVTSPLARPAAIPSSHIFVIGAERDQITPIAHARKLAAHFGCRFDTIYGGHLMQLGRSEMFDKIGDFLREIGFVPRRATNGKMK